MRAGIGRLNRFATTCWGISAVRFSHRHRRAAPSRWLLEMPISETVMGRNQALCPECSARASSAIGA